MKKGIFIVCYYTIFVVSFIMLQGCSGPPKIKATENVISGVPTATETTSISCGWDSQKNPETGKTEKVWVKLSESTTTTYSIFKEEAQQSHSASEAPTAGKHSNSNIAYLFLAFSSLLASGVLLLD